MTAWICLQLLSEEPEQSSYSRVSKCYSGQRSTVRCTKSSQRADRSESVRDFQDFLVLDGLGLTRTGPVRFCPRIPDSGTDRGRRNIETFLVIRLKMRKFEIVTETCSDIWIIAVGQGVLFMFQYKISSFF